ncbi:MAG: LysR family transcriptional regulator, partial [Parasphingorhabdus sp.]
MDNWDDYRFILALDRAGTVRGAALQLGVTHSTVSRRLAVINRRYARPVMERIAGGYQKT